MRTLVVLFTLGAALAAWAATPTQRVPEILATLKPGEPATWDAAEDALVKLGTPALPAIQGALAGHRKAQAAAQTAGQWDKVDSETPPLDVLDNAVLRLTWGINPRAIVTDYLHGLKFPDGRVFTCEGRPVLITDAVVARAVPGYSWYFAYYPGYWGGAYPSPDVLRDFEVPAPLSTENLFAVDKAGKFTLLTDREKLKGFVLAHAVPATTQPALENAVSAWLRLTECFVERQLYRFNPPGDFTVEAGNINTVVSGTAKVEPTPFQHGAITATLTFDERGRLTEIVEADNLQNNLPPPPAAPPGGPGGPVAPVAR